jgi:hypothetical protein
MRTAVRVPAAEAGRAAKARPLSTAALVVYTCTLALGLGVGSAYLALKADYPIGGLDVGPWTTWPLVGAKDADPYTRSIVTRRGEIPLAAGEGLAFFAIADSGGRPLDSSCTYRLGSVTPQARLWTLTLYDEAGAIQTSELGRSGFTSAEVLRSPEGSFTVMLSRDLQPGNWLQLPKSGRFTLALRLYDTPASLGTGAVDARAVPAIERLECGA